MKKYRHIPTEALYKLSSTGTNLYPVNGIVSDSTKIPSFLIHDSKDWEEVKEYKITAFRRRLDYDSLDCGKIFHYSKSLMTYERWLERFLSALHVNEIYAVERLSDGVEFKLGERAQSTADGWIIIESIELNSSLNEIHLCGINSCFNNYRSAFNLETVTKREKLFTTEDGVDVYEGGSAWLVNTTMVTYGPFLSDRLNVADSKKAHLKWFSTREAGEAYIKEQTKPKKLFTTHDGVNVYAGQKGIFSVSERFWDICELIPISERYVYAQKLFSCRKAAEDYVIMNKPCLSVKEVNDSYGLADLKDLKSIVKRKINI